MEGLRRGTALVTGGARQGTIGNCIARALASKGFAIALIAHNKGVAKDAAAALSKEFGVPCLGMAADCSDERETKAVVARVAEELGGIDILVNCAQMAKSGCLIDDLTSADLLKSVQNGLVPAFNLMKACHGHLKASQGIIVNLGPAQETDGQPGNAALAISKQGIAALTRTASAEWVDEGIRVLEFAPLVRTTAVDKWLQEFPEDFGDFADGLLTLDEAGEAFLKLIEH